MKPAPRKLSPLTKYMGGKTYLARWIIEHFPQHDCYVEPFLGGGATLLNKPPARLEVASDLYAGLINLYQVLQHPSKWRRLRLLLDSVQYDRDGVAYALVKGLWGTLPEHPQDDCQWALLTLLMHRMSRGGDPKCGYAWSERKRGGLPGDQYAFLNMHKRVHLVHERVQPVRFLRERAQAVIARYASHDSCTYCDPPYPQDTRTAKQMYNYEMSDQEHEQLLRQLLVTPGAIFISSYPNQLYERILGGAGWDQDVRVIKNHSAQTKVKQERREVLWFRTGTPGRGSIAVPVALDQPIQGASNDAVGAGAAAGADQLTPPLGQPAAPDAAALVE